MKYSYQHVGRLVRFDESRQYRDGGYEVVVRGPFDKNGCFKKNGSAVYTRKIITKFYVERNGHMRPTKPSKETYWGDENPDEWEGPAPWIEIYKGLIR